MTPPMIVHTRMVSDVAQKTIALLAEDFFAAKVYRVARASDSKPSAVTKRVPLLPGPWTWKSFIPYYFV